MIKNHPIPSEKYLDIFKTKVSKINIEIEAGICNL
jgi:hypothetical protein